MVRMPAFGLDGPWRDRAGFAMTIEQTSGLAWTTGYDDLPLVPRGPCDPIGGVHTLVAIHAALADRDRDGQGQHIEVPLLEVACNIAVEPVVEHSVHGIVLDRSSVPATWPRVLVACAGDDAWLGVEVTDDLQWRALCSVIGDDQRPALDPRPRLSAPAGPTPSEIADHIEAWAAGLAVGDAERQLLDVGVPAAAMRRSGDIVDHPQFTAAPGPAARSTIPSPGRPGTPTSR